MKGNANAVSLLLFSSFLVSFAIIFTGMHDIYGGFSGVSCAAISAILFILVTKAPCKFINYVLLTVFFLSLALTKGITADLPVASEAHWAGALSGVVFVLMQIGLKKNY